MTDREQNKGRKVKPKPESKPKTQNGKGDTPRNLSTEFRNNYDSISWKTKKK